MWPNSQKTADLVTFTEEDYNGKFNFCAVTVVRTNLIACSKCDQKCKSKDRLTSHMGIKHDEVGENNAIISKSLAFTLFISLHPDHLRLHCFWKCSLLPKNVVWVTNTMKNIVISPNLLAWKFCGKGQFPHSFGRIANWRIIKGLTLYPMNPVVQFHTNSPKN